MSSYIVDNSTKLLTSSLNNSIINSLPDTPYLTSNSASNLFINSNDFFNTIFPKKQDLLISSCNLLGI